MNTEQKLAHRQQLERQRSKRYYCSACNAQTYYLCRFIFLLPYLVSKVFLLPYLVSKVFCVDIFS